jgi:hypothetical protein
MTDTDSFLIQQRSSTPENLPAWRVEPYHLGTATFTSKRRSGQSAACRWNPVSLEIHPVWPRWSMATDEAWMEDRQNWDEDAKCEMDSAEERIQIGMKIAAKGRDDEDRKHFLRQIFALFLLAVIATKPKRSTMGIGGHDYSVESQG